MSTTTTNYGLVKPELTDAADITAMNPNWDAIDETLKDIQGEIKIKTYTSLEELGLDKTTATMLDIIKAIPPNSMLMYEMAQESYNKEAYPKNYGSVRIYHTHHLRVSCEFDSITSSANTSVERFIGNGICNGDSSLWSGWKKDFNESQPPTAADVGARPNTWTPTASDVGAISSDPAIRTDIPSGTDILAYFKTERPYGYYVAKGNSTVYSNCPTDATGWWFFWRDVIGVWAMNSNDYNKTYLLQVMNGKAIGWKEIYTSNNITSGTTDLTAGSSTLATGSIYLVYE